MREKNLSWKSTSILLMGFLITFILVASYYYYDGTPEVLATRAWEYTHVGDKKSNPMGWLRSIEMKRFSSNSSKTVYEINKGKNIDIRGRQVYIVVFYSNNPGVLGDLNVYMDYYTRSVIGVDLRL